MTDDVLDRAGIPSVVRDTLYNFRDIAASRLAAHQRLVEERRELGTKRTYAKSRLEEFRRQGHRDDQMPLTQLIDEIGRYEESLARSAARSGKLEGEWSESSRLVSSLEAYLASVAGDRMLVSEDSIPQLQRGETAGVALERAARRTRTLQADRLEVLAAPFPSSVAKKRAREQISARIAAAKPDATCLVERLEPIIFPANRAAVERYGNPSEVVHVVDPVALVAWAMGDKFLAALDKEIDAVADDGAALTTEQRKAKLATIDADTLASEREEAEFSKLCGVLPRPDIDPRAALGLAGTMRAPRRDD